MFQEIVTQQLSHRYWKVRLCHVLHTHINYVLWCIPLWLNCPLCLMAATDLVRQDLSVSQQHGWKFLSILGCKKKVKCTLVQALRLCTGRTIHRGSRGIALLFHDHGTRRGWGVSVTPRLLFTPGKDPVPIVQEAGWAPGPVWTGAENLAPTRIRSPDRPACSQLLYRLSYPAHILGYDAIQFLMFQMNVKPSSSGSSGPRRLARLIDMVHYIFICAGDQGGATVWAASESEWYWSAVLVVLV